MTAAQTIIQEQRMNLFELHQLMSLLYHTYGNNPLLEILNAITELAKAYRSKSRRLSPALNETVSLDLFYASNNLFGTP